jgi:rhodanese-related sulfurtransferase
MSATVITRHSTMSEVLEAYPSAQRALFQRYHIGGCNSCGYQPGDTLEEVARGHNILEVGEVIAFVEHAQQIDGSLGVSPGEVAAALGSDDPPRLIDVRSPAEWELARIAGATLMTEAVAQVVMRWPKHAPIVFYCHLGQRSLDAASYYAGHGFTEVRSMTGGLDAWSLEVDPSVPRYGPARDPSDGGASLRPLRSAVSEADGCQSSEAAR